MTVESIMEGEEAEAEVETAGVNEIEAEAEVGVDIEVRNSTWMLLRRSTTHRAVPRDH